MEASRDQQETANVSEAPVGRRRFPSFDVHKKPDEDRLVMLSDGIFAIAVTLLVLSIQIPTNLDRAAFIKALRNDFFIDTLFYAITFAVLATYWATHRQLMSIVEHIDNVFLRLNLLFLAFVAFFPVASSLLRLAQFPEAVIIYTVVLAGCGYSSLSLWLYAFTKHRLIANTYVARDTLRFVGIAITPTFLLLSLFLLYIPHFRSSPSDIFYSWLLIPFVNMVWIGIVRSLRKESTDPQLNIPVHP